MSEKTTEIDLAYRHCQRIARTHAKNFYYAFRVLPRHKRRAIYATYAFCRYCDDIADEPRPSARKRRLFEETRTRLDDALGGRKTTDPVFIALADAAERFSIPAAYFEEVISGVEMDLTHDRYEGFEDLRRYCYGVASVVGLICLEIFEYTDPVAREHAVDLGLAMQLTNIIRDVAEDAQRGRIYLPLDEIASFGYSERELKESAATPAFRELMRFQAARARAYFGSGRKLMPLISPDSRACPATLLSVYSTILDRIESSGFDVFERRIGLGTGEKLLIAARLWAGSLIQTIRHPGR